MNERFNGKVAIITGAARGIGKATSKILASEGCTVVIADINKEEAEKTKSEFNTLGYRAESFQCDISKVEDVEKLIASVHKQFERIDILVNNA